MTISNPEGHCRLCVVEIGEPGRTRLVNSCTYPVEKGLTVQTHSDKVWPGPAHGAGTAPGPGPGRRAHPEDGRRARASTRPASNRDPEARCILCGQCVRTCREIVGVSAISMAFRTPDKHGGHALQGSLRGLHRLRLLRLHLPHQRHRLHGKRRRPHRLGPQFRTAALHGSAATTSPPKPNWSTGPNSPATRWKAFWSAGIAGRRLQLHHLKLYIKMPRRHPRRRFSFPQLFRFLTVPDKPGLGRIVSRLFCS